MGLKVRLETMEIWDPREDKAFRRHAKAQRLYGTHDASVGVLTSCRSLQELVSTPADAVAFVGGAQASYGSLGASRGCGYSRLSSYRRHFHLHCPHFHGLIDEILLAAGARSPSAFMAAAEIRHRCSL